MAPFRLNEIRERHPSAIDNVTMAPNRTKRGKRKNDNDDYGLKSRKKLEEAKKSDGTKSNSHNSNLITE